MTDAQLKTVFTLLNYTIGLFITVISVKLYARKGLLAPLYITTAIVVAGPIENMLMQMVSREDRWIIDQITSVIFCSFTAGSFRIIQVSTIT